MWRAPLPRAASFRLKGPRKAREAQRWPGRAPVFHELGGQFDGVPLDAADAGNKALLLLREHVLQRVPKLVEQRLHLLHPPRRALPPRPLAPPDKLAMLLA